MESVLEVFLSNRLEILYQQLKKSLFSPSSQPLMRRFILVSGPAMKNWLTLKMAQDPELNVAMGVEFLYLGQAFEKLLPIETHFPTLLELSFAIEAELRSVLFDVEQQSIWEPVIQHLTSKELKLSPKMEKRLIGLSEILAKLFHEYGKYAPKMVEEWEKTETKDWQALLWKKLYAKNKGWSYPIKALGQKINAKKFSLFVFSISYLSPSEFDFLNRLSAQNHVYYFHLSPCAVFWSDIRSNREKIRMETYWEKKLGEDSPQLIQLDEYLRDRNPLLANFGKIGREMATQIEESSAQTDACYVLSESIRKLDENLYGEDLILTKSSSLTLLHALQADLLLMRNPQSASLFNFDEDKSLKLHIAPNKRREVEILYHQILNLMSEDSSLTHSDVIVMAPQIEEYAPFIQAIFGREQSQLNFQIINLKLEKQSEILQTFLLLLKVSEGRWDAGELLQLFGQASFQRCHQISLADFEAIQQWIENAGIHWGDNVQHRNELLQKRHCLQGMADQTAVGTWDYGLSRLILSLIEENSSSTIDFSETELLSKWVKLMHALRDDLAPLQDQSKMTICDWVNYLNCLLENYLKADIENDDSVTEFKEMKNAFEMLRASSFYISEVLFSFSSIKVRLFSLLSGLDVPYRDDHLSSIRFSSLMSLRSIPAKAIALLGMEQDAFPRIVNQNSLNSMQKNLMGDYCPSPTDFDRYLFLEVIHSAQNYLLFSYSDGNQKEKSLLLDELFSYLDQIYSIQGNKISAQCIFKHPLDAFDPSYFFEGAKLKNFSTTDFQAAQSISGQSPCHNFYPQWKFSENLLQEVIPAKSVLNLKHLVSAAKDPIRFHFNKGLEIYFENVEERQIRNEESIFVESLDDYFLKQQAIKEPVESVLSQAEISGKLPLGIFKEVAKQKISKEMEDFWQSLEIHSIKPSDIFEIEFSPICKDPIQLSPGKWLFPPVILNFDEGYQLSLIGKLPYVTHKGLITISKDSLADTWKTWPQFLLFCVAAKQQPLFTPQLIFSESKKIKKAFFDNPESNLKNFINYYALCSRQFSPLMPDWISFFLKNDSAGLEEKIKKSVSDPRSYQKLYLQKMFDQPFDMQRIIDGWKEQARLLAGDIVSFWGKEK